MQISYKKTILFGLLLSLTPVYTTHGYFETVTVLRPTHVDITAYGKLANALVQQKTEIVNGDTELFALSPIAAYAQAHNIATDVLRAIVQANQHGKKITITVEAQ